MVEDQINEYILKYNNYYSKEQIVSQLKNSGVTEEDINKAYLKINNISNNNSNNNQVKNKKKGKALLGLFLILIGLLIPVLGYILIIIGIVLGFKHRKISKDGLSMFVIIFGIISLILGVFTQIFIYGTILSYANHEKILYPAKVSLNNDLSGDSIQSFFDGTDLKIVFTYNGYGKIGIDGIKSTVIDSDGTSCNFQSLKNINNEQKGNEIYFLSSQMGIITFNCNNFDKGSFFNKKNKFEGSLKILLKNPKTESEVFSKGDIRLSIRK